MTKKSKVRRFFAAIRSILKALYGALYGFVLYSFKSINRKVRSKLPVWRMEEETLEHIHLLIKIFKWVILPASILYAFLAFYFLKENVLDSTLWGMLIFVYSNFVPDLPSIYRKKKAGGKSANLPWYKRYALLLFAPVLIWILFAGVRPQWKTAETFHDFQSLIIYGAFLFALSFLAFANFPISAGNLIKVLSLPIYGVLGYLTHLKVDKIW